MQTVRAGKLRRSMGKRKRVSQNRLRRGREAVLAEVRAAWTAPADRPDCTLCGKSMARRAELPWHRGCGLDNGLEF